MEGSYSNQHNINSREVEIVGTPSYLLMLEDAILLNMPSIRDGDKLNLIPATSLNNYIVNHTSKLVPANGTPLVNFSPPSLQNLQKQIAATTQPLRD